MPHHQQSKNGLPPQSHATAATKVQKALSLFQYISKGGAPLLLSTLGAMALIFGTLGQNLSTLLLSLSLIYALYLYSAPIVKHPRSELSEVIKLTLPLMWVTSLWVSAASFAWAIDAITPISALLFGLLLSLIPRYLIPILFLITICFELSLFVQYPISFGSSLFHLIAHLITALTLPRKVSPEWVIRSFYPRLLDIEELPLKDRFFDPSKYRSSYERVAKLRSTELHQSGFVTPNPNLTSDGLEWDSSPLGSQTAISGKALTIPPMSSEYVVTGVTSATEEQNPNADVLTTHKAPKFAKVTSLIRSYSPIQGEREIEAAVRAHNQRAIAFINRSMKVQLELLRQQLHVETAALLWLRPGEQILEVRAVDTIRDEWTLTQFDRHYGILEEALIEPLSFNDPIEAHCLVPYYDESLTIGGLLSYPITLSEREDADGILIVDRGSNEPWEQSDRATLRIVAEKMALDIETSRLIRQVAFDGGQVERLCFSLRQLNEAFDINDVARCVVDGVGSYEGFDSATYLSLERDEGLRLTARWLSKRLRDQYDDTHFLSPEVFISWDKSLIFKSIEDQTEFSTLTHPEPPSSYLSCFDGALISAGAALMIPLRDPQSSSTLGVLILTAQNEEVILPKHLSALRILIEQVAVKLSSITAHERLKHMALRDGLTGLKNHMTFQSESTEMLKRSERDKSPLTFALIDIDHFKSVNDSYGHPFGDEVLKRVAAALDQEVRDIDLVSRYGGEEFALALHATDLDQAFLTMERVRSSVEQLVFYHKGEPVNVTISTGIACYPIDSRDKERLVDKADKALYQSKRNGRNRVTAWRDIAPEQRDSSVGWTRHPVALEPQNSIEVMDEEEVADIIDSATSSVLITPIGLDRRAELSFDLEDMVSQPDLSRELSSERKPPDTQREIVLDGRNLP